MADIIPSDRRYNWQAGVNVGVPGGHWQYRARTVVNVTGLDNTGTSDCSSALQGWIDAAADDTCLLVPAGTFRLNSTINVGMKSDNSAKKRITLRGAGMGQTILKTYSSAVVAIAGGGDAFYQQYPANAYLTADIAAGATTGTIGEAVDFSGGFALLQGLEDNTLPIVGAVPYARPTLVYVTASSGNNFTFEPPLPFPLKAGSKFAREVGTQAPYWTTHAYRCGIEDLTVDGVDNSGYVDRVAFYTARECWLYNVEVKGIKAYGINLVNAYLCTVRHCVSRDQADTYPAMNTRCALSANASTGLLIADNLFYNNYAALILNAGVALSAFVYNMSDRICGRDSLGSDFNINHGAHNSFNLYEGNIMGRIQSDGYFGSSSNESIVRNWIHGTNGVFTTDWGSGGVTVTGNQLPVTLNRFAHYFNVVGNQVGRTVGGLTWTYANAGRGFDTTSTTSLAIGTGDKNFTFGTGLSYNDDGTAALAYSAADPTKWMTGRILDYNSGSGTCRMVVTRTNGSGTVNDWIIKGGRGYSNNYLYVLGGPNIGNGSINYALGIVAPQTLGIWWPAWDGKVKVARGAYNSATAYSVNGTGSSGTVDNVSYNANGQALYAGGAPIDSWLAANPAKNGLTTWDTPGPDSVDWLPIGANSLQELDYDSYGTAIIKGNWNPLDNAVPSHESLGGDTVATSYVYAAKPGYLGNKNWPVFEATSPSESFTALPAGHRYEFFRTNGTWVGSDVSGYDPADSGNLNEIVRSFKNKRSILILSGRRR